MHENYFFETKIVLRKNIPDSGCRCNRRCKTFDKLAQYNQYIGVTRPDLTPSEQTLPESYLNQWSGAGPGRRQGACERLAHRRTGLMPVFPFSLFRGLSQYLLTGPPQHSLYLWPAVTHTYTGNNQSRRKWHRKKVARGLGSTPSILIIVAHVCNYNVNTALCGPNQQDFVERDLDKD